MKRFHPAILVLISLAAGCREASPAFASPREELAYLESLADPSPEQFRRMLSLCVPASEAESAESRRLWRRGYGEDVPGVQGRLASRRDRLRATGREDEARAVERLRQLCERPDPPGR